jgi:hypothetical protein
MRQVIQLHTLEPQEQWFRLQELCLRKASDQARISLLHGLSMTQNWKSPFVIHWIFSSDTSAKPILDLGQVYLLIDAVFNMPVASNAPEIFKTRALQSIANLGERLTMREYVEFVLTTVLSPLGGIITGFTPPYSRSSYKLVDQVCIMVFLSTERVVLSKRRCKAVRVSRQNERARNSTMLNIGNMEFHVVIMEADDGGKLPTKPIVVPHVDLLAENELNLRSFRPWFEKETVWRMVNHLAGLNKRKKKIVSCCETHDGQFTKDSNYNIFLFLWQD